MQNIITLVLVWLVLPAIAVGQDVDNTDVTAILNRWHETAESQPEYRAKITVSTKDVFGGTISEYYLYKSVDEVVLHCDSHVSAADGTPRGRFPETTVWNKNTVRSISHEWKMATVYSLVDTQKAAGDKSWWNVLRNMYRMRSSLDEAMPFVLGVDPNAINERFYVTVLPWGSESKGVVLKFVPTSEDVVGGLCYTILTYIPDGQPTPLYLKYFDRGAPDGHRLVRIAHIEKDAYVFPELATEDLQKKGYKIHGVISHDMDSDDSSNSTMSTGATE